MRNSVLGLVYTNAHDVLTVATNGYSKFFYELGYAAETIDLTLDGSSQVLAERLDSGEVAFCFGMQGVGAQLMRAGTNLWTSSKTPFVALHYDNPCYQPANHSAGSPYVGNLYHFESFLEIQNCYIGGNQPSAVLPFDIMYVPPETRIPFATRPIRLLFLKAGETVDEVSAYIDGLPFVAREAVWALIDFARQNPNLLICDLVDRLLTQLGMDRREHAKDFWTLVRAMDTYIRRERAIEFVNWLKFQEGAVVVGNGWDFIDRAGAQANFRPAVPALEAFPLYEQAQFICNVTPYGRDIIHERVVQGLMAGSCVITDDNAWWARHGAELPALTRFRWDQPLDDQLQRLIADKDKAAEASLTGRAFALHHFSNHNVTRRIAAFAEQVRANAARGAAMSA